MRYITASLAGQNVSIPIMDVAPSLIVPGPTPDGARVVLAQDVDGVTGYYIVSTTNPGNQIKLFDGEAPGNNYPAPVFAATTNVPVGIYVIRDIDGQARLQCYNLGAETSTRSPSCRSPSRMTSRVGRRSRRMASCWPSARKAVTAASGSSTSPSMRPARARDNTGRCPGPAGICIPAPFIRLWFRERSRRP
ncbi:MAG: hypothetical protein IPK52_18400 [Chloroflexi bacterium]|nr:hypothetical protein [Chloroflexota bacterium]